MQKGTSGSLDLPGPHAFKAPYFWLYWNLLGAGETASSSRRRWVGSCSRLHEGQILEG